MYILLCNFLYSYVKFQSLYFHNYFVTTEERLLFICDSFIMKDMFCRLFSCFNMNSSYQLLVNTEII